MIQITEMAHAKINLGLDVLEKRPDGYHTVRMIMQSLALADEVRIGLEPSGDISDYQDIQGVQGIRDIRGIRLTCMPEVVSDPADNLAYRAAKRLLETVAGPASAAVSEAVTGPDQGSILTIDIVKHIPAAAGMAGGSADAAAVLRGVNRLTGLGLDQRTLMEIGRGLGADVPFCVMEGTALAEGIGEILTPVPELPDCAILLAKPDLSVSTPWVYRTLDTLEVPPPHPEIDRQLQALQAGDLAAVCACLGNVLAAVTEPAYPVVSGIREQMLGCGAMGALMSGSGPTGFGILRDQQQAARAEAVIRDMPEAAFTAVTRPLCLCGRTEGL